MSSSSERDRADNMSSGGVHVHYYRVLSVQQGSYNIAKVQIICYNYVACAHAAGLRECSWRGSTDTYREIKRSRLPNVAPVSNARSEL
jgi:hypothetical protein